MDWNLIVVTIITGVAGLIGAAVGAWIGGKITERATREATLEAQRRAMTFDEHQKTLRLYESVTDVKARWSSAPGEADIDLASCIRDVRLLSASTLDADMPQRLDNVETLLRAAQSAIASTSAETFAVRHYYAVAEPLDQAAESLTDIARLYASKLREDTL